jgi:hypothetical protein
MLQLRDFGFKVKEGLSSLDETLGIRAAEELFHCWVHQSPRVLEHATLVLRASDQATKQWAFTARRKWDAEKIRYVVDVAKLVTGEDSSPLFAYFDPFG